MPHRHEGEPRTGQLTDQVGVAVAHQAEEQVGPLPDHAGHGLGDSGAHGGVTDDGGGPGEVGRPNRRGELGARGGRGGCSGHGGTPRQWTSGLAEKCGRSIFTAQSNQPQLHTLCILTLLSSQSLDIMTSKVRSS
ncbi:hypothetical protein ACFFX0_15460 [Citricoccus parietis]|uniref:Uncharacterized protein n=1 Tax=Citricoccus parietis TaxID=592307 RepID=A0ABV5G0Q4_9MICC